jgi:ABC-type multidrug transport system ATPase subunit
VVLAKWLLTNSEIFIFDEPTRGIDVGAKAEIYALIRELADKGAAILMISFEMPELLQMSDRILVMHEGDMVGEMSRAEASEERVVAYAPAHRAWSRCTLTARVCACQILSSDGNRSSANRSWGGCRLRSCREVGQGSTLMIVCQPPGNTG